MTPMKIKTRFYFNDGSTLAVGATFGKIVELLKHGDGVDKVFLFEDQDGREHLILWKNITHIENCYNRYDQLEEHVGEKSELGVAADFVQKVPHSWGFPQTDFGDNVWAWVDGYQGYFPKQFQQIYIKIADTLLKEWKVNDASGKINKLQKRVADIWELDPDTEEKLPPAVTDLYKLLRSKMPEIERKHHDEEDK